MSVWLNDEQAITIVDSLRMHYLRIDQVRGYPIQLSAYFAQQCIM